MAFGAVILILALIIDRIIGDPHSRYHPVALIGSFIGIWGKPALYPDRWQRIVGIGGWFVTVLLFILIPVIVITFAPAYLYIPVCAVLLSFCFAWKSLEQHVHSVEAALEKSDSEGRKAVQMIVSRDVTNLSNEQIRSAAYESASENLVDSIIAPIFWFAIFEIFFGAGLVGAAIFRAANTMDAMLGYRDERVRIGWFSARMDDILAWMPARITGGLLLTLFTLHGHKTDAYNTFKADRKKRPGFNGGIPMSLLAGGTGVMFDKPGVYTIGTPKRTLKEGGPDIIRFIRETTILFSILLILLMGIFA